MVGNAIKIYRPERRVAGEYVCVAAPLVSFAGWMRQTLTVKPLIFYPAEVVGRLEKTLLDEEARKAYARSTLYDLFAAVRVLAARRSSRDASRVFPSEYRELFTEFLHAPSTDRDRNYVEAIINSLARQRRLLRLIHLTGRVIRNLAIDELVLAGDCWDRGPRGDRVVEYLMQQPNVSLTWGNHDAAWIGACLGQDALICQVIRISIRYQRLLQLEEGYGIPLAALENLARTIYREDDAGAFAVRNAAPHEAQMMARMQKAVAMMQLKLEGQAIARHPEWNLEHRRLLHRIDAARGVVVDESGEFLPMTIGGKLYRAKALFEAIECEIYRLIEEGARTPEDLDLLWYLWSGPASPLFGKDRIATFERDLISDERTHREKKNPYFRLIHEAWFCEKVLSEFGVDPADGMIVNGHVPVKLETGESPVKRSGKAVTIDGAFSQAYGDHGFTLVLEPLRTYIATHHHFESVQAAIEKGADIIPTRTMIREWDQPRKVADGQRGRYLRFEIERLERLIEAYKSYELQQRF